MRTKASLQLLAAVAIWGFSWLCGRVIASEQVSPILASAARFFIGSLGLLVVMLRYRPWPRVTARSLAEICFMGVTGVVLYNICFFIGLRTVPAGRASLVAALQPALVFAAAAIFWRESIKPMALAGLALSFIGAALILSHGSVGRLIGEGLNSGDLWILGCALSWAAYSLMSRNVMKSIPAVAATAYSTWFGTAILIALAMPGASIPQWSFEAWAAILFLGTFGTTVAFLLYLAGLKRVGPSQASIFISLVPLFGVLFSSIFLGERLDATAVAGGICAIAGVYAMNRR